MSEEPPVERAALVGATLDAWQRELTSLGGPNTLLWYRDGDLALDLTRAHPGGVARFLAGRLRPRQPRSAGTPSGCSTSAA